jgi:DNA-binding transcriptional ArsR family regulator
METSQAVTALAALAQDNRLDIFRLLVRAGPDGMAAGQVAERLGLAPNTLTFHFDRLRTAGLVTVRRDGRSMIYAARFETMNGLVSFLTENCCQGIIAGTVARTVAKGAAATCAPVASCKPKGASHEAVSRARRRG